MTAHRSTCCPVHGCKYGINADCMVATRQATPAFPRNNSCKKCADDLGGLRPAVALVEQMITELEPKMLNDEGERVYAIALRKVALEDVISRLYDLSAERSN